MTKILKKAGALALSAGILALMAMPALAATTYTPVEGTSCNFNKYLIMDAGDTVPTATFTFTVAPGNAIAAGNGTMQILAGVGTPTIADVTFGPSDTTATTATGNNIDVTRTNRDRGGATGDTVQLDAGEKYATKQATIDFSSVRFNEPGIYRYIITETADENHATAGIIHDTDTDRVLDVYVTDNHGSLVVSAYVLHTDTNTIPITTNNGSGSVSTTGTAVEHKTDGFTNEYSPKDLKISKEVTGNQASHDKYFALTVHCKELTDTDTFVVSLANDQDNNTNDGNADATSGNTAATITKNQGQNNPTNVTGAELKEGVTFYLQHGQNVVIRGLPINTTYYVTENAEDYKSTQMSGKTNGTSDNPAVIGTVAGENKMAEAGFTNTRDGIIPTGITMAVGGAATIVLLGGGGAIAIALKNKKRKNDNDD